MEKLNIIRRGMVLLLILLSISSLSAKNKLLMIRTAGENFEEAKNGMAYELEQDFDISDFVIDKSATPDMIKAKIDTEKPNIVVLMNNTSVSLYKKYSQTIPADSAEIPSVSLMAILVNDAIEGLKNATGIGYEIPIVTSSVNLRSVFGADKIKKIGIVNRAGFTPFIEGNRQFCKNENIELVTKEIGSENVDADLKAGLKFLIDAGVSALWVPGDNKLVNKELLTNVWIPFLQEHKMPVVVGVKNLVDPKFGFGTYAVLPDHSALGSQAASIIYDIMNNEWKVAENGSVQPALSVYTILNYPASKDMLNKAKEEIEGVDQILE